MEKLVVPKTIRANKPLGTTFQAIVSVTAVNIQFNSPNGVRRSIQIQKQKQ
jgi:hypothetical protein